MYSLLKIQSGIRTIESYFFLDATLLPTMLLKRCLHFMHSLPGGQLNHKIAGEHILATSSDLRFSD